MQRESSYIEWSSFAPFAFSKSKSYCAFENELRSFRSFRDFFIFARYLLLQPCLLCTDTCTRLLKSAKGVFFVSSWNKFQDVWCSSTRTDEDVNFASAMVNNVVIKLISHRKFSCYHSKSLCSTIGPSDVAIQHLVSIYQKRCNKDHSMSQQSWAQRNAASSVQTRSRNTSLKNTSRARDHTLFCRRMMIFGCFQALIGYNRIVHGFQSCLRSHSNPAVRAFSASTESYSIDSPGATQNLHTHNVGLYKKFADHATEVLLQTNWFKEAKIPNELSFKAASSKELSNFEVQISTKAMIPKNSAKELVNYARITLLETIPSHKKHFSDFTDTSTQIHPGGIQALNIILLPNKSLNLPVLGIDFASLPGSKNLLLMDAQPMIQEISWNEDRWEDWYKTHVAEKRIFPWGGDLPHNFQKYLSSHALWTKLHDVQNPNEVIQVQAWEAFKDHLSLYLELLGRSIDVHRNEALDNVQKDYLDYRRRNDPAKRLLTSLYGKDWTNDLWNQVLFPSSMSGFNSAQLISSKKSGRSARKHDRAFAETHQSTSSFTNLQWETFDFSHTPKWDSRFSDMGGSSGKKRKEQLHVPSSHESDIEQLKKIEDQADVDLQADFERRHRLWFDLDKQLIQKATRVLAPFVNEGRQDRIRSVLEKRTRHTRFLFENPANPSNVWACLRTIDSFGIQNVDVVIQSGKYQGKAALSQKRGMRVAMGSAKWLTVKNHINTVTALQGFKRDGYHIICADVNSSSKDIRDVDWDAPQKPICIVMGNEESGISDAVKTMADESFYLPMVGFAESFNLSAATAITCAHLSASSNGKGKGPLRPGDLSAHERSVLLLRGFLNSVSHKTATALFRKEGLKFPEELNLF